LEKANIKLHKEMEMLLSATGTGRSAEGCGKSSSESQRKAALKKRKAIKGGVALCTLTKLVTVVPANGGARRGLNKRKVKGKLMGFLETRCDGDFGVDDVLQLLSVFFDVNL
jgi:hypothetical protein